MTVSGMRCRRWPPGRGGNGSRTRRSTWARVTDVRNTRAQVAIERLGAVREGVLRKHRRRADGSWRDTVLYAMLDDDWPAARQALTARLDRRWAAGTSAL